jgi:hypothetical protein
MNPYIVKYLNFFFEKPGEKLAYKERIELLDTTIKKDFPALSQRKINELERYLSYLAHSIYLEEDISVRNIGMLFHNEMSGKEFQKKCKFKREDIADILNFLSHAFGLCAVEALISLAEESKEASNA